MDFKTRAMEYFHQGYNCCQAVVLAFHKELGLDKETAVKLSSSFGGGMGGMREVCGAVSGMFLVAGLKQGYTEPKDPESKQAHYRLIQELAEAFKQKNHSLICRDLLGASEAAQQAPQARTAAYYKKRPCAELVGCAAEIAAEKLGF